MTQQSYNHPYEPIEEDDREEDEEEEEEEGEGLLTMKSLSQATTQIIPCLFAIFINLLDAVRCGQCDDCDSLESALFSMIIMCEFLLIYDDNILQFLVCDIIVLLY